MENQKNYITPGGLEKLKEEYSKLFHGERPKLVEVIAWAASNGDRSENADYIYGKRRLREIDSRLRFLGSKIEKAFVVDPSSIKSQTVVFGATVTILNEDEIKTTYKIVGEDETDVQNKWISWKSPVANALMGKKVGNEVIIKKPQSEETVVIEKIEYL